MAEEAPRHRDIRGLGGGGEEVFEPAVAGADVDEFVHIDMRDPFRLADERFLQRLVQRVLLGGVAFPIVVVAVLENAHVLQAPQNGIGAVAAIIGVDQEVIEAHGAVIGDPFDDIGRFVFHAGDDDIAAVAGRQCARGHGGIGGRGLVFARRGRAVVGAEGAAQNGFVVDL